MTSQQGGPGFQGSQFNQNQSGFGYQGHAATGTGQIGSIPPPSFSHPPPFNRGSGPPQTGMIPGSNLSSAPTWEKPTLVFIFS